MRPRGTSLIETLVALSIVAVLIAISLDSGLDTLERVRTLVGGL